MEDLSDDCRGLKSRLPDGRFEDIRCREAGEMRLCLSAPGMANIERTIKLERGKTLELGEVRMEPTRVLKVRVTIMTETQGYRARIKEEGGFRFEKIGPGPYTLLVVLNQAIFRAPLTVGEKEETFTVDIPEKPTRIFE